MIYKVNYDLKKIYEWEHNDAEIKKVEHNNDTIFQKSKVAPDASKNFLYRWANYQGEMTTVYDTKGLGVIKLKAENGNTDMYSLEIGDQAKYIDDDAFSGCTSLTGITIPSNVISLNGQVFSECSSVRSCVLGYGWNGYGWNYVNGKPTRLDRPLQTYQNFVGIENLKELSIPSTMTLVDNDFHSMPNLETLIINEGVNEVAGCFFDMPKLKTVYIPKSVTKFRGADNWGVKSIHIPNGNLKNIERTSIGGSFSNFPNMTMFGCDSQVLETFEGLNNNPKLKEVYFAHLVKIGDTSINRNESLEYIKLPDSLTWIGDDSLQRGKLKTIDIGNSITHIGAHFGSQTGDDINWKPTWEKLIIRNTVPPYWNDRPTDLTNRTIYVPDSSVTLYQEQWTDVASIIKPLSQYVEV